MVDSKLNQLVEYITAKLAYDKNYPIACNVIYEEDKRTVKHIDFYKLPTQTELQRWLREVHGIQLDIKSVYSSEIWKYKCRIRTNHIGLVKGKQILKYEFPDNPYFDTYEDALEAGLTNGLKLIEIA